jgi:hypothetical protein
MMESATIDDVVGALREAGLDIAGGPVKRREGAAVFLNDPDGVRVELQVRDHARLRSAGQRSAARDRLLNDTRTRHS